MATLQEIDAMNRANYAKYGTHLAPVQQSTGFNPASLIPVAGSVIGGVAGGLIGGPVGAGIGSAIGGGGGSALEQAITNKGNIDAGKVAQEAALSGVLGFGPLRTLGAVTGIKGGRIIAGQLAKTGAETALGKAVTTKVPVYSEQLAKAWGIDKNIKIAGSRLGEAPAAKLQQFASTIAQPIKVKNATNVQSAIESFASNTGKKIGAAFGKVDTAVNTKPLKDALATEFKSVPGIGLTKRTFTNTTAKDIVKQIEGAKTTKDLWNLRKSYQSKINFNRTSGAAEGTDQLVLQKATRAINNQLKTSHPELKQLFSDYHTANKAIDAMTKSAFKPGGIAMPGTVASRIPTGKATQAVRAELGMRKQGIASVTPTGAPSKLQEALMYGGKFRQGGGLSQLTPKNLVGALPSNIKRQVLGSFILGGLGTAAPTTNDAGLTDVATGNITPETVDPYPTENMMYDVSRDPKNASKYVAMYTAIQSQLAKKAKTTNLTEAQQARQDVGNLVDQVQGMLDTGNVKIGPAGILGKIEMAKAQVGAGDPSTVDFYTMLGNLTATIARTRGGTSFTANEQKLLNRYTPNENDSEQQIRSKLTNLAKMFTNTSNTNVYSSNDINNQVMQGL